MPNSSNNLSYRYLLPAPGRRFLPEPCPKCPLPGARKVGARGTIDSPLVIILEAPGLEELKSGAPACGPSGELLDKCTPDDFDFDSAYIINAMQCRPPKFNSDPNKEKDYKARACMACRSRVLRQVFMFPRKAILALGAWSNIALTNDHSFKITQRRGEVYKISFCRSTLETPVEIPVVPAVHPAFLLRGSGNPKVFRQDVALAIDLAFAEVGNRSSSSGSGNHCWEDPRYVVVENLPDLVKYIHKLKLLPYSEGEGRIDIAADIETSGFRFLKDRILCIGFYPAHDTSNTAIATVIPARAWERDPEFKRCLRGLLSSPWVRWIWQFGKFDAKFLAQAGLLGPPGGGGGGGENVLHEDTGLLSYALSEATRDHDLDELAKNWLGAPAHKDALKQWVPTKKHSYALVPEPVLFDYLAKDLKKTLQVFQKLRPLVASDPDLEKLYVRTLLPGNRLFCEIEQYGIHIDWDYVRINREGANKEDLVSGLVTSLEEEQGLEAGLIAIAKTLEKLAGYPVNPNSPGEVAELLYDRCGLRLKGKKPTDTRKETLDKLPSHPVVRLIREYRSMSKMLSTYVQAIEELAIEDRIHTTFKLHATTTGRPSSTEPNILNIPRESRYRRMYRARPGMKLMEGDYNSAELRMLAVLSQDKFLTEVFLDDRRNLHDEVAIAMYGENFTSDQRIRAKAVNFGIPYGREAFSIAMEYDMTIDEAQRLIDAWLRRSPEAATFIKACRRAPREGKTLTTVFGRKRRPGVVSSERLKGLMNEFANFSMQSTVADFTLHSGLQMLPLLKREGAHIVNLVYDSALVEYPGDSPERERQIAHIVKTTMEQVPKQWIISPITFKVDLKCGTHWGLLTKIADPTN